MGQTVIRKPTAPQWRNLHRRDNAIVYERIVNGRRIKRHLGTGDWHEAAATRDALERKLGISTSLEAREEMNGESVPSMQEPGESESRFGETHGCPSCTRARVETRSGSESGSRRLVDLAELSRRSGVTEARLAELCDGGFLPHVEIDGVAWFRSTDAMQWISENLTQERKGRPLPPPKFVILRNVEGEPAGDAVPVELSRLRELRKLPAASILPPCVYFLCRDGRVVYVGQSVNLIARLGHHSTSKEFDECFYLAVPRSQLSEIEAAFIHALDPPLNKTPDWERFKDKQAQRAVVATFEKAPSCEESLTRGGEFNAPTSAWRER